MFTNNSYLHYQLTATIKKQRISSNSSNCCTTYDNILWLIAHTVHSCTPSTTTEY